MLQQDREIMKPSNLKVGVIGLLIFCGIVVSAYVWQTVVATKRTAEHFTTAPVTPIVPWETNTHRYIYSFRMMYRNAMQNQYRDLLFGAYDRFKNFTKEYFNTYSELTRTESNASISVPNRQVVIQFMVQRIDKATNQIRQGRMDMSVNLNRLNDPNDTLFNDSLKKVLADYVNILM